MLSETYERCVEMGTPFDVELQIVTSKGRRRWVRSIGQSERDTQGRIVRVRDAFQKITNRKPADQATRELAERLETTLESITDAFFTLDLDWCFSYINQRAAQLFGRTRESLLGHDVWQEFMPAVGSAFELEYRRAMLENASVHFEEFYAPLGMWFEVNAYPSTLGLAVYFRDVTARRRDGESLRLLEASVSQLNEIVMITEAAPVHEPGPRILFVNDAFSRVTGYAREEVLGKSPRLLQGPLTDRGDLARISAALAGFQPVHAELINYRKDGVTYWIEFDIVPFGVAATGYTHFVAIERDITERKRDRDALHGLNAVLEVRVRSRTAALGLARDEAQQANRAKSNFLATMSHEIRTPMNGVIGMLDVLHQTSLRADQMEMVDLIRDSATSLLEIIEDILDFSKIEAGRMDIRTERMELAEAVEQVCGMLDHMAVNRGVRLTMFVDPAIPQMVSGDETRLRQVLINLVGNAIKFSSGRDHQTGEVSMRAVRVDREAEGVTIDLIVADNGIGMDEAMLARLFTPFRQADASTTRRFGGTGLGLAISNMLVRLMGGEISVRSSPGEGSTFTVRLCFSEVGPASTDDELSPALAGLRCRVVGWDLPLADDLDSYLTHAGVVVERSPDLAAAAAAGQPPGSSLWLVLPGQPALLPADLRALAPNRPDAETRFIILGWGKLRHPRAEAIDVVRVDADALSRRILFRTLALASGQVHEDAANDEQNDGFAPMPAPSRDEARLQGRLILVAEDNETNLKVIVHQLRLIGFAADVCFDGRKALESWRSGDYALLLTDLHMPEMDGYALVAAIRAEEGAGSRTPVIALTANALRDERLRCIGAGMDACLTKPIRLQQLRAAIEAALAPTFRLATVPCAGFAPVDLCVLTDLVGEDPAAIAEVLQAFRESAAESSRDLLRSVSAGLTQPAADAAHKLKSAARTVGALRLGNICAEIEDAGESGCTDALDKLIARFETELDAVLRVLESS